MTPVRALFVAVVALSVAALPVASGMARAAMTHDASLAAPQTDCCPHHEPCEKKTNDCGSVAGCALKCFNLTGIIVSGAVSKPNAEALARPALLSLGLNSNPTAPPLPPPRV
jgi:hypothetical protein